MACSFSIKGAGNFQKKRAKQSATHLVNLDNYHQVVMFEVHLMRRPHHVGELFDNAISR